MCADKTALNKNSDGHSIDLNEVVRAVCLDGDCYSKYSQSVRESYSLDTEAKVGRFLDELGFSRFEFKSRKMPDTYYLNLNYLGKEIGLNKKTIADIIHWQSQNVERWVRFGTGTALIILVIGSNASMKEMTPLHIPKSEKVDKEVQDIIRFYRDFGDASLAIVNYAGYAKVAMWPTRFKDIEKSNCLCTTIMDGEKCFVSDGLEMAMRLALLHEGVMPFSRSFIVLISDGADDDSARTQAILDLIKEKRTIEYYTYFVETIGRQELTNQIKKKFHDSMGGVSLAEPLAHSLDWWVYRDVIVCPWCGHEGYYSEHLH